MPRCNQSRIFHQATPVFNVSPQIRIITAAAEIERERESLRAFVYSFVRWLARSSRCLPSQPQRCVSSNDRTWLVPPIKAREWRSANAINKFQSRCRGRQRLSVRSEAAAETRNGNSSSKGSQPTDPKGVSTGPGLYDRKLEEYSRWNRSLAEEKEKKRKGKKREKKEEDQRIDDLACAPLDCVCSMRLV